MLKVIVKYGRRFVYVCAIAIPVLSCVSVYAPPEGGDTAQIDFVNTIAEPLNVVFYDDATECRKRTVLSAGIAASADRLVTVETRNELALTVFRADMADLCRITLSFKPEKEKNYRLLFTQTADYCYANVEEMIAGSTQTRKVHVTQRKFVVPFDETGHWCEAQ